MAENETRKMDNTTVSVDETNTMNTDTVNIVGTDLMPEASTFATSSEPSTSAMFDTTTTDDPALGITSTTDDPALDTLTVTPGSSLSMDPLNAMSNALPTIVDTMMETTAASASSVVITSTSTTQISIKSASQSFQSVLNVPIAAITMTNFGFPMATKAPFLAAFPASDAFGSVTFDKSTASVPFNPASVTSSSKTASNIAQATSRISTTNGVTANSNPSIFFSGTLPSTQIVPQAVPSSSSGNNQTAASSLATGNESAISSTTLWALIGAAGGIVFLICAFFLINFALHSRRRKKRERDEINSIFRSHDAPSGSLPKMPSMEYKPSNTPKWEEYMFDEGENPGLVANAAAFGTSDQFGYPTQLDPIQVSVGGTFDDPFDHPQQGQKQVDNNQLFEYKTEDNQVVYMDAAGNFFYPGSDTRPKKTETLYTDDLHRISSTTMSSASFMSNNRVPMANALVEKVSANVKRNTAKRSLVPLKTHEGQDTAQYGADTDDEENVPVGMTNAFNIYSNPRATEKNDNDAPQYQIMHAISAYSPGMEDEVELQPRDKVLVYQVFKDGWAYADVLSTGASGMVPYNYLVTSQALERLSDYQEQYDAIKPRVSSLIR